MISAIAGQPVGQIGILVHDLDESVARYTREWQLGPWRGWTYGPQVVPELGLRGEPGRFQMRIALCGADPQIELIEPVSGPSIYEEWMSEHGEGLHHLGVYVPSFDRGLEQMRDSGYEPVQWGRGYGADGDGGFAYYDLRPLLGVYVELLEVPKRRIPPDFEYPLTG